MRITHLLLACLCCLALQADDRDFKQQYSEGLKLLAAGNRDQAIIHFKEAYRLNAKAQMYKVEGTYYEPYLPRYQLALTFEPVNLNEAEDWAKLSKEAGEVEIIKKKKDLQAKYYDDLDRITKAAEQKRTDRARKYDMLLGQARGLLNSNKFNEAKTAFEELFKLDSSRSEAQAGLDSISDKRNIYIKGLELDARSAIMSKDLQKAGNYIAQIEAVDKTYAGLIGLRSDLATAKAPSVASATKPPAETPKESPRTATTSAPVPDKKVAITPDNQQARNERPQVTATAQSKDRVRNLLVASLDEYRRGEPSLALKKLKAITPKDGDPFASYHWLKGVYLLQISAQSGKPDEALLADAGTAMRRVTELLPGFNPDERLYPAFIISFFKEHQLSP